ncbi:MAG: glycosyltransferase, partial [Rivularia sp. ALOHA_DT_140]|nr:glycosyltransferase [Rivularia sp. ALOHA_DT_140]
DYLHDNLPKTHLVLLLREILNTPEKTIDEWQKYKYNEAIDKFYRLLLIVGSKDVFNFVREYKLPDAVANKVRFCGYIRRPQGYKIASIIREELDLKAEEKLVIVTPGGGQDGYQLINTYLQGQGLLENSKYPIKSLVFCGPEMPKKQKQELYKVAAKYPQVKMREFSDDLMSYLSVADGVVSMGGYNTICEILSAAKPAIIVPRIKPSQEQLIRSQRMKDLSLMVSIHPDELTVEGLINQVFQILENPQKPENIDLEGLPRIARHIRNLLADEITKVQPELVYPQSNKSQKLLNKIFKTLSSILLFESLKFWPD